MKAQSSQGSCVFPFEQNVWDFVEFQWVWNADQQDKGGFWLDFCVLYIAYSPLLLF